jgi:5-methylcytosine-specific restriction endonuclease McrA
MINFKRCSKCLKEYPATTEYFYKHKKYKFGVYFMCKSCQKLMTDDWRSRNKERMLETSKKYYEENKFDVLNRHKKYYDKNKDVLNEQKKEYYTKNKDYFYEKTKSRRAKKLNATGKYTKEDVLNLLIKQNYKCKYCGCDIKEYYEVDHIIPLSKGGSNWPDNLCIACRYCNRSKGNKTLEEFKEKNKCIEIHKNT